MVLGVLIWGTASNAETPRYTTTYETNPSYTTRNYYNRAYQTSNHHGPAYTTLNLYGPSYTTINKYGPGEVRINDHHREGNGQRLTFRVEDHDVHLIDLGNGRYRLIGRGEEYDVEASAEALRYLQRTQNVRPSCSR